MSGPLKEYDVVRIVRLSTPGRTFDGTAGVCRPPRIGDVATIVHEHDPEDPTASIVVETVDREGRTVWLADFQRAELERVRGA